MFRLFSFPILIFALLASGALAPVTDSGIVGIGSFWRYPIMIFGFLMLITVHEFGHWLFARIFGFATPVFSVGFGKRSVAGPGCWVRSGRQSFAYRPFPWVAMC